MRTPLLIALLAAGSLTGCATKEFVLEEAGKVDRRVAALEQALAEAKAQVKERLKQNDVRMDVQDARVATQAKNLDALGEQQKQTTHSVAEHGQRLQGTEKGLQRVRVDLTATQSRLAGQAQQVATLQTVLESERQANQHALQAQGQRVAGAEQGLQKVEQDLAGTKAEVKADAQALNQQLGQTRGNVEAQGKKVDTLLTGLDASKQTLTDHAQRLRKTENEAATAAQERATLAATANDALTRANAAGKLAEGKLMYASVLNHELSGFQLNQADLGKDAKAALKDFVARLKAENANVYLEIQGHTDTSGKAETNRLLSQRRAEAVRDFLYAEGGIPLHRMAVFAYGGSRPVANNKKREGRVQNRRVVIVVLK